MSLVERDRRGQVEVLLLNRPEALNAITGEVLDELEARLADAEGDRAVRAVVLTGTGEKAFAAGADIAVMREASAAEARRFGGRGHAVTAAIEQLPKPVIAAVNGYALGGGFELALACDIRLASQKARMGLPEVSLGIFPGWGGTQRLPRLISPGLARELIFSGRHVTAEEALAVGLVNHVFPPEELLEKAVELGELIATRAPLAVAEAKRMVNLASGDGFEGHLARELDGFALAFLTEDQREGMAAFLEKRPPRFEGR